MRCKTKWLIISSLSAASAVGIVALHRPIEDLFFDVYLPEPSCEEIHPKINVSYETSDAPAPAKSSYEIKVAGNSNPRMVSLTIENIGTKRVKDFWLWREGTPNFYNKRTLLRWIAKEEMTDEEKAIAIWDFIAEYSKNYWTPYKGSELNDPVKICTFPIRQCDDHTRMFVDLCSELNIKTRIMGGVKYEGNKCPGVTMFAHETPEALLNGKWVVLDPDKDVFYLQWDNKSLAGLEDCVDKNGILLVGRTRHIYEDSGRVMCMYDPLSNPYAADQIKEMIKQSEENCRRPSPPKEKLPSQFHHHMRFNLVGKEIVRFNWQEKSRFFWRGCCKGIVGKHWPKKFHPPPDAYSNGKIVFCPALQDALAVKNVEISGSTVNVIRKPAYIVFALRSPYLMLDTNVRGSVSANVDIYSYNSWSKGDVRPARWVKEFEGRGSFDTNLDSVFGDEPNVPSNLYRYFVKFQFRQRGKIKLERLCFTSTFQVNPQTLPSLSAGANRVNLFADALDAIKIHRVKYEANGKLRKAIAESPYLRISFEYEENENHQPIVDEALYPSAGQTIAETRPVLRWKAHDPDDDNIAKYHVQLGMKGVDRPLCPNMDSYVTEPSFLTEWVITEEQLKWIGREREGPLKGSWLNPGETYWWRVRARDEKAEKAVLGKWCEEFHDPKGAWEHFDYDSGYWGHFWHDKGEWGPWSEKFWFKVE